MNLSNRSKISLAQFLANFERGRTRLLFDKYDIHSYGREDSWTNNEINDTVALALRNADGSKLGDLLQEIAQTRDDMRSEVSPRYKFDQRWDDLLLCLELDGYAFKRDEFGRIGNRFVPFEPTIEGLQPIEDDLVTEIKRSGLAEVENICRILDNSASDFRNGNFNGCLANARVALNTLAQAIALAQQNQYGGNFDPEKWGQVVAYLRTSELITQNDEDGLTGVYSFISPGSHTPVGFTEQEFVRLGRSLAFSFSYFLVKQYNSLR